MLYLPVLLKPIQEAGGVFLLTTLIIMPVVTTIISMIHRCGIAIMSQVLFGEQKGVNAISS